MKRYLLLAPDAPDARAVQLKIYEWERKAKTVSEPVEPVSHATSDGGKKNF